VPPGFSPFSAFLLLSNPVVYFMRRTYWAPDFPRPAIFLKRLILLFAFQCAFPLFRFFLATALTLRCAQVRFDAFLDVDFLFSSPFLSSFSFFF